MENSNISIGIYTQPLGGDFVMELKCPKCGKSFNTNEEMVEHAKEHAKEVTGKFTSEFKL